MKVITQPAEMATWSAACRRSGARIGFVPTMGALHEGHLDLVRIALSECDRVVCSIFVNPLQFNDPNDLASYPVQLEQDQLLLEQTGCHGVFLPRREELFASFTPKVFDLLGLDRHWEGPNRPGHFQGVVNVVEQLFLFVRPDAAYFGEKDRQQLAIIRAMAREHRWPERIRPCPTVREPDGLAMSSRNLRLTAADRAQAPILHAALQAVARLCFRATVDEALDAGREVLATVPAVGVEYLAVAHPDTLEPLHDWDGVAEAALLIAARVGAVRLIDNITAKRP
ncbi:MAG: pantoate--beta-alanine ligase [Flavobacteriales bacterium]|nr:MAG: pantoate--beta-alanine ligase [Flavobacteriales bacterium]